MNIKKKRENGENGNYLAKLIHDNSVEEFIC